MKQLLPILLSGCLLAVCNPVSGQKNEKTDTLYLQKDSLLGNLQSIYLLPAGKSDLYDDLSGFKLLPEVQYLNSLSYYTKDSVKLEHHKPVVPWTEWVTLKQYNNQYYAYHPCDFLNHHKISMNDSTFIDWTGEGPYLNKVISYKKMNGNRFEVNTASDFGYIKTTIHIIDKKRGIAVFEQTYTNTIHDDAETFYSLMIAADKIKSVPIIINHCEYQKSKELVFDEIDFPLLLKR